MHRWRHVKQGLKLNDVNPTKQLNSPEIWASTSGTTDRRRPLQTSGNQEQTQISRTATKSDHAFGRPGGEESGITHRAVCILLGEWKDRLALMQLNKDLTAHPSWLLTGGLSLSSHGSSVSTTRLSENCLTGSQWQSAEDWEVPVSGSFRPFWPSMNWNSTLK